MVLGEQILRVGPLNIPVWLLAVLGGTVVSMVLQRTVWRSHRDAWASSNDALLSGIVVAILIWKLTPLVTRFAEIREMPSRLLYYPGGTVGLIAAGVAGATTAAILLWRRRARVQRASLVAVGLPVVVVLVAYAGTFLIPVHSSASVDVDGFVFLSDHEERIVEGRPTVITAWATWCGPCTAQMPEIDRFYREHGDEVNLIALNLTATESSLDVVQQYLEESDLAFPVALDPEGAFAWRLEVRSTPTTIVLDDAGRERGRRAGVITADWLTRRVLPLSR